MSAPLLDLALTYQERILLKAQGIIQIVKPALGRPPIGGRAHVRKATDYGRVRAVALQVVDGKYDPALTMAEIARQEGVGPESLKAAVWRARHERRAAS